MISCWVDVVEICFCLFLLLRVALVALSFSSVHRLASATFYGSPAYGFFCCLSHPLGCQFDKAIPEKAPLILSVQWEGFWLWLSGESTLVDIGILLTSIKISKSIYPCLLTSDCEIH